MVIRCYNGLIEKGRGGLNEINVLEKILSQMFVVCNPILYGYVFSTENGR